MMTLTANLHEKRQDIATHEDLSYPCRPDDGVMLGIEEGNDSTQEHVNRRCVYGRCHEDENSLHQERNQSVVWLLLNRDVPKYIAGKLDYYRSNSC